MGVPVGGGVLPVAVTASRIKDVAFIPLRSQSPH